MIAYKHSNLLFYWCQGCGHAHCVNVDRSTHPSWDWNESLTKPTLSPSVRHYIPEQINEGVIFPERTLCHYHIKEGMIQYCEDSAAHDLRGEHPLQEIPSNYGLPGKTSS